MGWIYTIFLSNYNVLAKVLSNVIDVPIGELSTPIILRDLPSGDCIIHSHDQYNGWTQHRVTEFVDCSHIYMHCYDDSFKGWAPPQIMLESPAKD